MSIQESFTVLDPCVVLDQMIQEVEVEMQDTQQQIDGLLQEWISLSLREMAFKRAGTRRKPEERKHLTVRRVECRTQARTLSCKIHDLSSQMEAFLALKDSLNEPDIAQKIEALREEAQEISTCPD